MVKNTNVEIKIAATKKAKSEPFRGSPVWRPRQAKQAKLIWKPQSERRSHNAFLIKFHVLIQTMSG